MSRLDKIQDWISLAAKCRYNCNELAQFTNTSERHLRRYFAEALGLALHQWISDQQYGEAASLLAQGFPIKDVKDRVGIKDGAHLSRQFKKHFGVSISEMRRNLALKARMSAKRKIRSQKRSLPFGNYKSPRSRGKR